MLAGYVLEKLDEMLICVFGIFFSFKLTSDIVGRTFLWYDANGEI